MAKRTVDWQAVALDYAAGLMPVREIAQKHSLASAGIYAMARREGWGRAAAPAAAPRAAVVRPRKPSAGAGHKGSKHAMRRMIGLVNRLADELSQHLDQAGASDTTPTEQKFAADIVTSLTRTLEKLTQLEREAGRQGPVDREQAKPAGAHDTSSDTWDELQRRLARLAAASEKNRDSGVIEPGTAA